MKNQLAALALMMLTLTSVPALAVDNGGVCSATCTWRNGEPDNCRDNLEDQVESCLNLNRNICEEGNGIFSSAGVGPEIIFGNALRTAYRLAAWNCEYPDYVTPPPGVGPQPAPTSYLPPGIVR